MNPWILNFWYFIFHFNFWTRLTLSCLSKLLMNAAFGYIWILSPRQRKANSEKHSKLRRVSILIPWYDNITWHNGRTGRLDYNWYNRTSLTAMYRPRPQRWYTNTSWTHPHRPGKFKICGGRMGEESVKLKGRFKLNLARQPSDGLPYTWGLKHSKSSMELLTMCTCMVLFLLIW